MSLAGFKKQINKANQYMSEKMGGAEATKLTDEFSEMERMTDATNELVEELIVKTKEYLQPNPASRAKLMAYGKISKMSGQARANTYPQPEGTLGEAMVKYGKMLGDESSFAKSLQEAGESLKLMADVKYALEDNVKQNFLEPLHLLQNKDLKDVMYHRKKLQGRRLDFDCKRRKQQKGAHVGEDEIKLAEEKFEESFSLAQMGMHNLLENEVEQVSQMAALAEALYEYHQQCSEILKDLRDRLFEQKADAVDRPKSSFIPKKLTELGIPAFHDDGSGEDFGYNGGPPPYSAAIPVSPLVRSPYQSPQRSPLHSPMNPHPPSFPSTPSTLNIGSNLGAEPRSPARSPISSPVSPYPPSLEPLFPPGGPPQPGSNSHRRTN